MHESKSSPSLLQKVDNAGMKAVKGGYTTHTVTVTAPRKKKRPGQMTSEEDSTSMSACNADDGDDGIRAD